MNGKQAKMWRGCGATKRAIRRWKTLSQAEKARLRRLYRENKEFIRESVRLAAEARLRNNIQGVK